MCDRITAGACFVRDSKAGAGPASADAGARQGRAAKIASAIFERLTESLSPQKGS